MGRKSILWGTAFVTVALRFTAWQAVASKAPALSFVRCFGFWVCLRRGFVVSEGEDADQYPYPEERGCNKRGEKGFCAINQQYGEDLESGWGG